MHVLKVKFVDSLLPWIRDNVRPMVDWDMKFDAIVGIAEKIQTTSKPGGTHSGPPPRKPYSDKQWSAGKPMQLTKSDWKAPPNIAAAKKKQHHTLVPRIQLILDISPMLDLIRQTTSHMAQ